MTFEEWFAEDTECSFEGARRYAEKNPHMVKCWQAATLAERERAAKVAESGSGWGDEALKKIQVGELVNTPILIAAAIRKGEGV